MFDNEIFDGKKYSDLLKEIHSTTKKKEKQITDIINVLSTYIESKGDAVIIAPILATYLGVSVSNNEHLLRLAGIIQRYIQADKNSETGELLSEKEKEMLMEDIKKLNPN